MYRSVPPRIDLPAMEREILASWKESKVFERSLAQTQGKPQWVFYEGPPTANGMPGTHHVEARVFKDVFPRYRTMKGYHVPRMAGWDCHGLPVELAVEKELGFTNKSDIEAYGVDQFNKKCRESVERHVDAFTEMTERMGFWVDFDQAYWTMNASYVESVWWALKQIFDKGLLVQDHRVAPYCPRCGTGLSDHELAQGYETIVDPSVYVKFPLTSGVILDRHPGAALLVWTTTPWTIPSNLALAFHPEARYGAYRVDGLSQEKYEKTRVGGRIEAVFFCPHTPEDHCTCRKPLPGLFQMIGQRFGCDLAGVPMVGDLPRDVLAAQSVGCEPHLVRTGQAATMSEAELQDLRANPDQDAVGVVIEAKTDRHRGVVATLLVQTGTLQIAGSRSGTS